MFRGSRVPQHTHQGDEVDADDAILTDSTRHLCSVDDMCSEGATTTPSGEEAECAVGNGGHLDDDDDANNQPNNTPQFFVNMMYEELPPNAKV